LRVFEEAGGEPGDVGFGRSGIGRRRSVAAKRHCREGQSHAEGNERNGKSSREFHSWAPAAILDALDYPNVAGGLQACKECEETVASSLRARHFPAQLGGEYRRVCRHGLPFTLVMFKQRRGKGRSAGYCAGEDIVSPTRSGNHGYVTH
jgi:hypothetical protein